MPARAATPLDLRRVSAPLAETLRDPPGIMASPLPAPLAAAAVATWLRPLPGPIGVQGRPRGCPGPRRARSVSLLPHDPAARRPARGAALVPRLRRRPPGRRVRPAAPDRREPPRDAARDRTHRRRGIEASRLRPRFLRLGSPPT